MVEKTNYMYKMDCAYIMYVHEFWNIVVYFLLLLLKKSIKKHSKKNKRVKKRINKYISNEDKGGHWIDENLMRMMMLHV